MQKVKMILAMVVLLPCVAIAQQKAPTHFDVISIKPHKAGDGSSMWGWNSSGYQAKNVTLKNMIAGAYDVQPWLVFGLPQWTESTHWDLQAKVLDANGKALEKLNPEERRTLQQSVLKDRFGLMAHMEQREQPVFDLKVLPGGPKFKESPPPPPGQPEPKFGHGRWMLNSGSFEAYGITMLTFAVAMTGQLERNIIDKTGLAGDYDLKLKWTPEGNSATSDNGSGADAPLSIYEALKEQLGLKLTAAKAPVPVVVIEKLQQPDEN